MPLPHRLVLLALGVLAGMPSLFGETAYFLMHGPVYGSGPQESYVVTVSNSALIQEARDHLAAGGDAPYLIPRVGLDHSGDPENRNYAEPGHPAWNWRAANLVEWTTFDPRLPRALAVIPNVDGPPSSAPALLAAGEHRWR